MTPAQDEQVERFFHAAIALPATERATFLAQACAPDEELRGAVERLLGGHERANDFLDAPVWRVASTLVAPRAAVAPGRQLGHYRVHSLIGKGGMGEVYLAEDVKLERKVALKLLPAEFTADDDRVRRFEREAKAASALNHPNILTIYEMGEAPTADGNLHFIAAEYVEGHTLREHLAAGSLPLEEALELAVQMASALSAAHAAGIIHRDFKPENVMVRPDGLVKTLDFGLAKLTELRIADRGSRIEKMENLSLKDFGNPQSTIRNPQSTTPGVVMGTASYMSPEQARGQKVDVRTDVFSFGVVLYEMLAGRQPFAGVSASDVIAEILKTEPMPLAPDVPPELAHLVNRALGKDRDGRHRNGAELLAELKAIKRGLESGQLQVATSQPSSKAAMWLHAFKWRWPVAALLLMLIVAVAWFFYARRAPVLTEKDTILLADFTNTTGEAVFDGTLRQALAVQLEQTPFLNLLPEERLRDTLRLMERQPEAPVTREVAVEVCRRRGLKVAIVGAIAKLDQRYAITLEAIDGQSGSAISRTLTEAEGKDHVLRSLQTATNELREKLGESLASRRQFNAPLEEATTKSLEALQAYSLGIALTQQGNPQGILHYRRAIELDPDFAMAYAQLSNTYSGRSQLSLSAEMAEQAYRRRARVSERERLKIESVYYSNVTHEEEKWFETLSLVAQTYAREANPHSQMAFYYNMLGQTERALEEAREAVRLSDGEVAGFYIPLATALIRLNRFDEARQALGQALERKRDALGHHTRLYQIGFVQQDVVLMQQQLDWARGRVDEYRALDWQAQAAAFAGRMRVARDFSQRTVALARQHNLPEPAAAVAVGAVLCQAIVGNERTAKDDLARAAVLAPLGLSRGRYDNTPLPVGALALALSGDLRQAQRLIVEVERQHSSNLAMQAVGLPVVRAAIALSSNDPARAIELLEPSRNYESGAHFWPTYLRAQAYLKLRRGAEAAAEFQKIIDHRGWDPISMLWPLAHLGLAQAAALVGDTSKSQQAYQSFFTLWAEADADLPLLRAAQRERMQSEKQ